MRPLPVGQASHRTSGVAREAHRLVPILTDPPRLGTPGAYADTQADQRGARPSSGGLRTPSTRAEDGRTGGLDTQRGEPCVGPIELTSSRSMPRRTAPCGFPWCRCRRGIGCSCSRSGRGRPGLRGRVGSDLSGPFSTYTVTRGGIASRLGRTEASVEPEPPMPVQSFTERSMVST